MPTPEPFGVDMQEVGDHLQVLVRGELDLQAAPRLRTALLEVTTQRDAPQIEVDLSAVTFIDSTGVSVILQAWQRVNESGGRLVLCATSRPVARVLETAGLADLLTTSP
jgi:anti-sigma B factor antagonist